MKNEEIASLIKKIKEGDNESFEEIYKYLWNILYYSAQTRLASKEDAKDAVQETMIEIFKNISKLRDEMAFIAWANRILVNKCAHIHKLSKQYDYVDIVEIEDDVLEERMEFLPEEILGNKETCDEIIKMVSQLPEKQKSAILLYYFNGLSTKEIAYISDSNNFAIAQALSDARKNIKSKLEKIQKKGGIMYSVTTLPVLTRIFLEDMETICTPDIRDQIYQSICEALFVGGSSAGVILANASNNMQSVQVTTTAVETASAITGATTVSTGLVIKISAAILTITFLGGGIAFYVHKPAPLQNTQVTAIETATATPTPTPIATPKPIEVLDDMVGQEDADTIRSWAIPSTENNNEAFMQIVEKHGLTMHSAFIDIENNSDMYALFTKEEQDKRLLLCEHYDSTTKEWAAVYSLESIDTPIPETHNISTWFAEVQSNL